MRYLKSVIPLTLLYIALTANAEPRNWLLGVLRAIGITALLRPTPTPINWQNLPKALLATGHFVLTSLWDLLVSSFQVTRLLLQRDVRLRQGVFTLPTKHPSPQVSLLSAHAITLTPGELVVEMDEAGLLYVHSLDVVASAEKAPQAQQQRVKQLEQIV